MASGFLTLISDKIPADDKKAIEEKIGELKKVKDSNDDAAIKKAMDDLNQSIQKIGEQMYKSQSTPEPPKGEGKKDDGTIEGEFKEKK